MVKVLVLGATGNQGGATIRALLASEQKHSIRALVRDASSEKAKALVAQGVEVLEGGDWDKDVASLEKAVAGVEAVFFISNFNAADAEAEVRGATNIVDAAKRSGTVNHVLYSTVGGIDYYKELPGLDSMPFFLNYWESKAKGEELVRQGGFAHYTLLRPVEFMSNWTNAWFTGLKYPDLLRSGVLYTAFSESQIMSEISPDDIGRVAGAAIEDPGAFAGGRHELHVAGELLTLGELVKQLGEVAGKNLRVHTYAPQEAEEKAKTDVLLAGDIARRDWKAAVRPADDFGLGFSTFREYLEKHKDEVRELYKNVP